MSTNPTPTPPHKLTQLSGKWFRTLYELLHEVHTIKICIHHCNDEIAFVLNTCENAPEEKKCAKVQSKAQKYSPVDLFREIWWPVWEIGRWVLYPGVSWIIGESWHICITYIFASWTCNMLEICCLIILAGNSDEDDGIVPDDPMQNTDNTSNLNCDSGR